jgi:hypothetical protein
VYGSGWIMSSYSSVSPSIKWKLRSLSKLSEETEQNTTNKDRSGEELETVLWNQITWVTSSSAILMFVVCLFV